MRARSSLGFVFQFGDLLDLANVVPKLAEVQHVIFIFQFGDIHDKANVVPKLAGAFTLP